MLVWFTIALGIMWFCLLWALARIERTLIAIGLAITWIPEKGAPNAEEILDIAEQKIGLPTRKHEK